MKASFVIPTADRYRISVTNPREDHGAAPFAMQLYRNRTRLSSTDTLHEIIWRGTLDADDLIEADGQYDVTLLVVAERTQPGDVTRHYAPVKEKTDAHPTDPRDDDTHAAPV